MQCCNLLLPLFSINCIYCGDEKWKGIVKEYLLNECELKAYDTLLIQCAQ